MSRIHPRSLPVLLAGALTWLAAGCGTDPDDPAGATSPTPEAPTVRQVDAPEPRLAITYIGGVLVVRASDGEVLGDVPMDGFLRVNPAGDDRHAFVSVLGQGFTALDLGSWSTDHGDHGHSYVDDPELTDWTVPAEEPGHVVLHDGHTTLFDDGTGTITAVESHELADLGAGEPELHTMTTEDPHHGVAVLGDDHTWLTTVGTVDERNGVQLLSEDGEVLASTDRCPGVHGEAYAGDAAVLGCEDGVVVVDGERMRKVAAPDPYGRIGNQAGSETSPYVLGDYKTDPDAELERPTRVSIVDTRDASLRLVDLGTSYSFRSLGRTPDGGGLVLGTDGALHVVDPARAAVTDTLPVVDPWREPLDWEQPRPTLEVVGSTAYVTEPATREVHVVDLDQMAVVTTFALPEVPNELVGVTG